MPSDTLLADGTSRRIPIGGGSNGVHISFEGSFGGGTLAIEKIVAGEVSPLRDGATAITFTAADGDTYLLKKGDVIQFTLSGATAPSVTWSVTGN